MSGNNELQPIDWQILGVVEKFIDEQRMCPTLEEIGERVNRSIASVWDHVQLLKEHEYLLQDRGQARSIRPGPRLRR